MNHNQDSELRPNPDALLKEIQKEEGKKGKLKIFLGYSPGVGKTYSMLLEAHTLKERGDDVVVGIAETHQRSETAELLNGLEVIPRKTGQYKGITIDEMDLDAILKRKSALVLVDELAHTNASWSRHPKRYLDVEELLASGIDVYTTVNIQHFESQNDIVAKITGIRLQETIPDYLLERADEVQVIDIPLEELFERLHEGKVYIPEQAQRAMVNFFQRGNLVALREITLSVVARKMDSELLNYMKAKAIQSPWPAAPKLMVCIAPSPYAVQLVRKAYQVARNNNAEWYAVHISSPALRELSKQERTYLSEAFNLAEEFGARTATLTGFDVVPGLLHFAQENNISQIIIGKPRRSMLLGALSGSPVYRLINSQRDFDLYLASPTVEEKPVMPVRTEKKMPFDIRGYLVTIPVVALTTVINLLLQDYVHPVSLYAFYLVATIIIALLFGTGPSIWAAIISLLAYDFFFIDPRLTLTMIHPADVVSALVFFLVSIGIGQLLKASRRQYLSLAARTEHLSLLEKMSRELLSLPPVEQLIGGLSQQPTDWRDTLSVLRTTILDDIGQTVVRYLSKVTVDPSFVFFKGTGSNLLQLWARSDSEIRLTQEEQAVAEWVLLHSEPAGAGTDTLSNIPLFFVPIKSQDKTIGVVGIKGDFQKLLPEQRQLLSAISNLASLSAARWVEI
jgi:two-component system, OmpR family, sensor histidine kinase KdpD